MMKNLIVYISLLAILLMNSCTPEKPIWESGYLVPLLSTTMSINHLVEDSLVKVENDGSITLVYEQEINTVKLNDLVTVPNTGFDKNYQLSNLNLNDQQFNQQITLGMLAQSWPFWGVIILSSNGGNLTLPNIQNVTAGPYSVSIQNIFQSATLNAGLLDISITNGFPIDLENVEFEISNASSGTVIVTHTFPVLLAGTTESITFNIAGKTIEGNLNIDLLNLDVMGGGQSHPININDALDIELTLRNLKIQEATAVFPSQNIINEDVKVWLALGDPKIKHIKIETGEVLLSVTSTIQDDIYFNYKFPKAIKNGNEFEINEIIPPATSSSPSVKTFTYDFSGYELDLRGEFGFKSNILYGKLLGRIDSTGNMTTLNLDDSIHIHIEIRNLKPNYVNGYLGTYKETVGPVEERFTLFDNFVGGELLLESAITTFSIENSVGVEGGLTVNELKGRNSKNGNSVVLQSSAFNTSILIEKATDHPLIPKHTTIILDPSNSNIAELISITPDNLTYSFELNLNEGIDSTTTNFSDFAYANNYVKSKLGIEIPLSMIAKNLLLQDTILFDKNGIVEAEGAKSGTLHLLVDNGFPIQSKIEIKLINESYEVVNELNSAQQIESAPIENGRVTSDLRSIVSYELSEEDVASLLNSSGVILFVTFNTADQNNFLKIYNDYKMKIKLTGEFNYQN